MQSRPDSPVPTAPIDYDALMRMHLAQVFGQRDPLLRSEAIARLYAPDAALYEPHAVARGHAQISGAVTAVLQNLPEDFTFVPRGPAHGHHDTACLLWSAGPADGAVAVTGIDVATFRDGRIASLHVFLDPSP